MRPRSCSSRRDVLGWSAVAAGGIFTNACARLPAAAAPLPGGPGLPGGLEVRGTRFYRDGRVFFMNGVNHWAAPTLARTGNALGWDRVRRDLDALQAMGINALRVMSATEGPDTEPHRIVPSIQPSPGRYEAAGVEGVARLADELRRRGLYGIFTLTNFWSWSGGMAQYRAWAHNEPIPALGFEDFAAGFYESEPAKALFRSYVRFLVPELSGNPAVLWELANEPRSRQRRAAYRQWIDETARLIKSMAPGQLVTTGSEGEMAGLGVVEDHRSPAIDFATCHMWAQNWGWVNPATLAADCPPALERAQAYLQRHAALATTLGKPIILEEFGFPRDGGSFDASGPTTLRDRYFAAVYDGVRALSVDGPMAGIMPWAWAGESRPSSPGASWRPGDPLTGDPPHEPQGWYGIYDRDATVAVIREGAAWSRS
jgi:mannan endo-1,4-beta-mannosidase